MRPVRRAQRGGEDGEEQPGASLVLGAGVKQLELTCVDLAQPQTQSCLVALVAVLRHVTSDHVHELLLLSCKQPQHVLVPPPQQPHRGLRHEVDRPVVLYVRPAPSLLVGDHNVQPEERGETMQDVADDRTVLRED
eukprot:759547-Hanusia_phi.AAC.1